MISDCVVVVVAVLVAVLVDVPVALVAVDCSEHSAAQAEEKDALVLLPRYWQAMRDYFQHQWGRRWMHHR